MGLRIKVHLSSHLRFPRDYRNLQLHHQLLEG
jgi:hypothetical protein